MVENLQAQSDGSIKSLPQLPGENLAINPEEINPSRIQLTGEVALAADTVKVQVQESLSAETDIEESKITPQLIEKLTPESLEKRAGEALGAIDFEPTQEVAEHLKSFFESHYTLALGVDTILAEDPKNITPDRSREQSDFFASQLNFSTDSSMFNKEEFDSLYSDIINYGNMPPSITRIITPFLAKVRLDRLHNPNDPQLERAEQQLLVSSVLSIFNEASVGITALNNSDKEVVTSLYDRVKDYVKTSSHFDKAGNLISELPSGTPGRNIPLSSLKDPLDRLQEKEDLFWNDTLYAGQLLFHNSINMSETRSNGRLLPRRMQKKQKGKIYNQTSEQLDYHIHSPTIHWSENFTDEYKGRTSKTRGTIAMTIKKIISSAPYARDAEYSSLRVKPDRLESVKSKVKLRAGTGRIGMGSSDFQGSRGMDRTFYSSPHDVEPDTSIELAPDGYEIKQGPEDYAVTLDSEETNIALMSGTGEGFPSIYELNAPRTNLITSSEDYWKKIAEDITKLQQTSIDRWPDEFVIPVRAGGVIDFYVPDDGHYLFRPRARFTQVK